ncbi:antirestriction protein ArdA [Bifidobacterium breve]|nr:antirestriction protein ArdA [Bifidobacterium breve]
MTMETEDDLGIRVWVGNLGKYVEGELKGGWASLPMPNKS